MQNMLAMYGKGRVGKSVVDLGRSLGIEISIFDDVDEGFNAQDFEAVIPTPGVNPHSRAWSGGNTLSELDFSFRYLPKGFKICAITGTDGKSTTTWITYELLRKHFGDTKVFISGNFEDSFAKTVTEIREKWLTEGIIVLEVSSFMAHGIGKSIFPDSLPKGERDGNFTADVSIFTNFETDHLNWHADLQEYLEAKLNLLFHTKEQSFLEEKIIQKSQDLEVLIPKNSTIFGVQSDLINRFENDGIWIWWEKIFSLSETQFRWRHNGLNFLSASLACKTLGLSNDDIRKNLASISGLPHRLEKFLEKDGITYIDDSKATSAQALRAALESFPKNKNIILMAGGSDKGDSFESLQSLFQEQVKSLVAIGATANLFVHLAESTHVPYNHAHSMHDAVIAAKSFASPGDVILLSPGCASFGMFRDYLDRAEQFRHAVHSLN